MDILMTEINGMVRESDMNIKEYVESTIDLIDRMDQMELIRSSYFTEAKKDSETAMVTAQQKSLLEKIKDSIKKIFDKLVHAIPNLFKKIRSSSQRNRVEKIGDKLNKMSKMGIDLGKIKVSIPNIQAYDSFINSIMLEYILKFEIKTYGRVLGAMNGPIMKIDGLIKSINSMTSELTSGEATKNNINDILKKLYRRHPGYAIRNRSSLDANTRADQRRRGNTFADNEMNSAVKNKRMANMASTSNLMYGNTLAQRGKFRYESTGDTTITEGLSPVDDIDFDGMETALNVLGTATVVGNIGIMVITFVMIGAQIYPQLKRFFSNAPSKVKTEVITVSALYKRAMDMKLDVMENRLNRSINEACGSILKGMTLEEFAKSDDKNRSLVKAAQKICELLNAYTKFQIAELNYYYRILLEVDSKLSVKNAKKANGTPIVTKEATDTEETTINMEDFMDLESFMSIE